MISSKFKMAWFAGIVARCLEIWSWMIRCKVLVGIPLGPQDLSMLRDDITLQISSLFVAFIMKESLFFVDKKPLRICLKLNFLTEQSQLLIWKSYWKYLRWRLGHWCILRHFWLWMVCHCFYVPLTLEI